MPPSSTATPGNEKHFSFVTLLIGILAGGVFVGVAAAFFLGIQVQSTAQENAEIRSGVYLLEGLPPGGTDLSHSYTGMVTIYKAGSVYDVSWYIGNQTQWGVGIVNGDIFSVSYFDDTGGTSNDFGVVSYRIVPGGLEGEWASALGSGALGSEKLTWRSTSFGESNSGVNGSAADAERAANAIDYEANRPEGDTSLNPYGNVSVEQDGNVTNVYVR